MNFDTKCAGESCPLKETCARWDQGVPTQYVMYYVRPPYFGTQCDTYIKKESADVNS